MKAAYRTESGSVMVLALLLTMLILGVGLSVMWIASSDTKITTNISRRQEALNAAEAGLERARIVLATSGSSWTELLSTTDCSATKDDLASRGKILCEGDPPLAALEDVPAIQGSSLLASNSTLANVRYTIYVRNDDAEAAVNSTIGLPPQTDLDQRVIVRVEATGRDALSFFALEAVVANEVQEAKDDYSGQAGGGPQGDNSGVANIAAPGS